MMLMVLQIVCSVAAIGLLALHVPNYVTFGLFVFNLSLFQKLVFTNVAISLLNTFDIKNVRIANYVNG